MNNDPKPISAGFFSNRFRISFRLKIRKIFGDPCWRWMGRIDNDGYGRVQYRGKVYSAHRVAFALANGRVPAKAILHSCDNPPCCNPLHLSAGTNLDNSRDMVAKNRQAKGERHFLRMHPERIMRGAIHPSSMHPEKMARGERVNTAKLKASDVVNIRKDYVPYICSFTKLAARFECSPNNIREIIHRRTWRHLL